VDVKKGKLNRSRGSEARKSRSPGQGGARCSEKGAEHRKEEKRRQGPWGTTGRWSFLINKQEKKASKTLVTLFRGEPKEKPGQKWEKTRRGNQK